MIDAGADLTMRDSFGNNRSIGIWTAIWGDVEILKALDRRGYDFDEQDPEDGNTMIIRAAWNKHYEACDFLIEKKVDIMKKNHEGEWALDKLMDEFCLDVHKDAPLHALLN